MVYIVNELSKTCAELTTKGLTLAKCDELVHALQKACPCGCEFSVVISNHKPAGYKLCTEGANLCRK